MEHGTRYCYVMGCRCVDCTAANTEYHRGYRRGGRSTGKALLVTCWCGAKVRFVDIATLALGRTFSCGIGCSRFSRRRLGS